MKDYMDEARELLQTYRRHPPGQPDTPRLDALIAAFGQRCREDGLEEAAQAVATFTLPADWMRTKIGVLEAAIGDELVARIRALKGGSNG